MGRVGGGERVSEYVVLGVSGAAVATACGYVGLPVPITVLLLALTLALVSVAVYLRSTRARTRARTARTANAQTQPPRTGTRTDTDTRAGTDTAAASQRDTYTQPPTYPYPRDMRVAGGAVSPRGEASFLTHLAASSPYVPPPRAPQLNLPPPSFAATAPAASPARAFLRTAPEPVPHTAPEPLRPPYVEPELAHSGDLPVQTRRAPVHVPAQPPAPLGARVNLKRKPQDLLAGTTPVKDDKKAKIAATPPHAELMELDTTSKRKQGAGDEDGEETLPVVGKKSKRAVPTSKIPLKRKTNGNHVPMHDNEEVDEERSKKTKNARKPSTRLSEKEHEEDRRDGNPDARDQGLQREIMRVREEYLGQFLTQQKNVEAAVEQATLANEKVAAMEQEVQDLRKQVQAVNEKSPEKDEEPSKKRKDDDEEPSSSAGRRGNASLRLRTPIRQTSLLDSVDVKDLLKAAERASPSTPLAFPKTAAPLPSTTLNPVLRHSSALLEDERRNAIIESTFVVPKPAQPEKPKEETGGPTAPAFSLPKLPFAKTEASSAAGADSSTSTTGEATGTAPEDVQQGDKPAFSLGVEAAGKGINFGGPGAGITKLPAFNPTTNTLADLTKAGETKPAAPGAGGPKAFFAGLAPKSPAAEVPAAGGAEDKPALANPFAKDATAPAFGGFGKTPLSSGNGGGLNTAPDLAKANPSGNEKPAASPFAGLSSNPFGANKPTPGALPGFKLGGATQPAADTSSTSNPAPATGSGGLGAFGAAAKAAASPFGGNQAGNNPVNVPAFGGGGNKLGGAPGLGAAPGGNTATLPTFGGNKQGNASAPGVNLPTFGAGSASNTPAFGAGNATNTPTFGVGNAAKPPAFGAGNTPAFGAGNTPAFGAGNTPAFGAGNTPAFGAGNASNPPAFGAGNTTKPPTFGAGNASNAPTFGAGNASSTPAFGASKPGSMPSFGSNGNNAANAPTFGAGNANTAFGGANKPGNVPTFGGNSTSIPTFGAGGNKPGSATPAFGAGGANAANPPAFGGGNPGAAPAFGANAPAFGANKSANAPSFGAGNAGGAPAFGAGALAPNKSAPAFGGFNGGNNPPAPFGNSPSPFGGGPLNANKTTPAFGAQQQQQGANTPAFGAQQPNKFGGGGGAGGAPFGAGNATAFGGGAPKANVPTFGQSGGQQQQQQSGGFNFSAAKPNDAKAGFNFASTPGGPMMSTPNGFGGGAPASPFTAGDAGASTQFSFGGATPTFAAPNFAAGAGRKTATARRRGK